MADIILFLLPSVSFALCFVMYRKGISDGIKLSKNESLKTASPVRIKFPAKKTKLSPEQQKFQRGFQNILEYKNEGGFLNEKQ